MKRRGMSQIITTVIMIGIVLVAVGAVWVVAQNILSEGLEDVSLGSLKVNLDIENVKVTDTGLDVKVKRNSGEANLVGINFVVSDGENTEVFEEETDMKELATQTFSLDYDGVVKSVEIAPVLANENGKKKIYDSVDKKETKYSSCLEIFELGENVGDGIYTIDVDGFGDKKESEVYCDMTTDEGGWTRLNNYISNSSVSFNKMDVISTNLVSGDCGSPGTSFRIDNILVNYTKIRIIYDRTTTIGQCTKISGTAIFYGYWNSTINDWKHNGMCGWNSRPWANAAVNDMTGLALRWKLINSDTTGIIKFQSECSSVSGDNGIIHAEVYVK